MCTVLLRYEPAARWPILLAAVRDEFVGRAWDPPDAHWGGTLVGGRDRLAGGTWLAVDAEVPALAAVLNGERLPVPAGGERPSRGFLPLAALGRGSLPDERSVAGYDGFHLVRAAPEDGVSVLSWDGTALRQRRLGPGDHIIVNRGPDAHEDPVVARFLPMLAATATPDPTGTKSTVDAWGDWVTLAAGDGLDPGTRAALLVRREFAGRAYGSTSVSLVALASSLAARPDPRAAADPAAPLSTHGSLASSLAPGAVRYDFSGSPWERDAWRPVLQTE